jgi:transcriptional regulator with XRE-family HTH domain
MTDAPDPGPTRAEQFGQFAIEAAREAGYDVDSPRGGGKKALAEAAGMSHASVSRMLAGQSIPDPKFFEPLAGALGIQLPTLLIRSGLASQQALGGAVPAPVSKPRLTIRRAAAELGIRSERGVQMFITMAEGILAQEPEGDGEGKRSRGVA